MGGLSAPGPHSSTRYFLFQLIFLSNPNKLNFPFKLVFKTTAASLITRTRTHDAECQVKLHSQSSNIDKLPTATSIYSISLRGNRIQHACAGQIYYKITLHFTSQPNGIKYGSRLGPKQNFAIQVRMLLAFVCSAMCSVSHYSLSLSLSMKINFQQA